MVPVEAVKISPDERVQQVRMQRMLPCNVQIVRHTTAVATARCTV